jgi:hypothetical protein
MVAVFRGLFDLGGSARSSEHWWPSNGLLRWAPLRWTGRLKGSLGRWLLVALPAIGCRANPSTDPPEQPASPQAKAEPAPIASLPAPGGSGTAQAVPPLLDGGVQPLRGDREPQADATTKESAREGILGYSLEAVLRVSDVPAPAKGADGAALDMARKGTESRLSIDVAPTHARIVLGPGFVWPEGTELRARADRYGHIVYTPPDGSYRVAAPGALRAVLGERRLDVAPLLPAEVTHNGEGPRRFGHPTHKAFVATRAAKASFEIGHLADLGDGGSLLCRSLLELISAPMSTPLCSEGDVPLRAELRWTTPPAATPGLSLKGRIAGAITFEVISIVHRTDIAASSLATPPPQAAFLEAPFPFEGARLLLGRGELAALRGAGAEASLTLVNSTDELRFVWLDGTAMAWVAPGSRLTVPGLVASRYVLQWRTFLADAIEPAQTVNLPATSDLGATEWGAPP